MGYPYPIFLPVCLFLVSNFWGPIRLSGFGLREVWVLFWVLVKGLNLSYHNRDL